MELVNALEAVISRLVQLSAEDEVLRTQLRTVARAFLDATGGNRDSSDQVELAASSVSEAVDGHSPTPTAIGSGHAKPTRDVRETLPPLTLGTKPFSVEESKPVWSTSTPSISDTDLPLIEARCRLKAEGCRWAAARHRRLADGADFSNEIEPKDREIIGRARAMPECYLWMNGPNSPVPPNVGLWEDAAGCFEAVANGVGLIRSVLAEQSCSALFFDKALDLLAEAQSALRSAVGTIDEGRFDTDQAKVFSWLKATTAKEQVFIQRYMRVDDPADPETWTDISARIEDIDSQLQKVQQQKKQQESGLRKIRYHLKLIQAGTGRDHDWRTIMTTVEELVKCGLPPSNVELREILVPVVEDMPDLAETPVEFQHVLREIDRFLASRPTELESRSQPPNADVQRVATLLAGRKVVMIAGLRRPLAKEALEAAFRLKELIWFETREHESVNIFEPYVAQPDVDVVLLAIRWSSHSYGEVKQFCDKHGKLFVRLPGGYNPNQVARQIVQQCGDRLDKGH